MHVDFMRQAGVSLPVASMPTQVTSLRVWHCKFKDLSALSSYEGLEELAIASFPHDSLELVAALPQLRNLKIVHLPKVTSLAPLAGLENLESLSLATLPAWDSANRRLEVASLEPLTKLRSLRHLELFGVCPPDRSLADLYGCKWIRTARFSQFPRDTIDAFYRLTGAASEFNPPARFERPAE
jgi:hypothetical protein